MNEPSTSTSAAALTNDSQAEDGHIVSKPSRSGTRKRSRESDNDKSSLLRKQRISEIIQENLTDSVLGDDELSTTMDDLMSDMVDTDVTRNLTSAAEKGDPNLADEGGIEALFWDVSLINNMIKKSDIKIECDENEIFALLEQRVSRADRVNEIVDLLISRAKDQEDNSTAESFMIESVIQSVLAEQPNADPNHVYQLLEEIHGSPIMNKPSNETIRAVINKLKDQSAQGSSNVDEGGAAEIAVVRKLERYQDLTQGYEFVLVALETLGSMNPSQADFLNALTLGRDVTPDDPLLADLKRIIVILPDINPIEVYTFLDLYRDHPDRMQLVINNMMKGNSTIAVDGTTNRNSRNISSSGVVDLTNAGSSYADASGNSSATSSSTSGTSSSTSIASSLTSGANTSASIASSSTNGPSSSTVMVSCSTKGRSSSTNGPSCSTNGPSSSTNGPSSSTNGPNSSTIGPSSSTSSSTIDSSSNASNEASRSSTNELTSNIHNFSPGNASNGASSSSTNRPSCSKSGGESNNVSNLASTIPPNENSISSAANVLPNEFITIDDNGTGDEVIYVNGSQPHSSGSSADSEKMAMLINLFPDCDTHFIRLRLAAISDEPYGMDELVSELLERNYPKLQVQKDTEQQRLQRDRLMKLEMDNIEAFLELIPDPEKTFFTVANQTTTDSYREHAMCRLYNDFPLVSSASLTRVLKLNENRYAPSWLQLKQSVLEDAKTGAGRGKKKATLQYIKKSRAELKMPNEPCEVFYRELQYVRNRDTVQDYIKNKESERVTRFEQARQNNELQTCSCCYDDEILFEEMEACPDGHLFCRECVRRSIEVAVGEDKANYTCLDESCKQEFPMPTLRRILPAKIFSLCLRKMQEEAIRLADIDNLVSCPFCPFSTIMDDPNDKLFRCLNPQCLRESCRFCREPNHIPLRCNEIEKSSEKEMRTFIEAQMSEAMIRECHRCHRRFYKVEGCNKMTCVCGASMCYVCRKPIKDYSHFDNNGGCAQMSNMDELHTDEMMKAAQEAQRKYLEEHPEATDVVLKHDPIKLIQSDAKTKHRK